MRQVPTYLIIGSGRVAQHFQHYFTLSQIPYKAWSRKFNSLQELPAISNNCLRILLLLNDKAIHEFVEQHAFLKEKTLIHFSGCLSMPGVFSAHPLMTFGPSLYDLTIYQRIPFILSENSPDLSFLLPGIPNSFYRIPDHLRMYYHAMCVVSGNFTTLLWQKFFKEIQERFHLPREVAYPYLEQVMLNLRTHLQGALTGPLARGDQQTVAMHLQALDQDEFRKIYQSFLDTYSYRRSTP